MQSHPNLWSRFVHFAASNESVSRQWRPWSGCASAQFAIWAFAVHICLRTRFRMAWQIYGWFFKLFSLISWYLNIHCVFIYFMRERKREREREREREFITLNWLLNCGIKQCKYKTCLAIFILFALFRYLPRLKVTFRCVSPYFYIILITEQSYEGKYLHLWKL